MFWWQAFEMADLPSFRTDWCERCRRLFFITDWHTCGTVPEDKRLPDYVPDRAWRSV